jgi:hypothetical protein
MANAQPMCGGRTLRLPAKGAARKTGMPTDVNVLIRGQSNAMLFTAFGAAGSLEQQLEARVPGVDIHILAEYATATSTMYAATGFLNWPEEGEQQGLLAFIRAEPADIRDNPTITLWMHNEFDANTPGVTTSQWVAAVRADAALVRDALGQDAATTPYTFTYVNYLFTAAGSPEAIKAGMNLLSADPGFNARFDSTTLNGLVMDGPGEPPGGHIGFGDAYVVADRLADFMAGTVVALAGGTPSPGPFVSVFRNGTWSQETPTPYSGPVQYLQYQLLGTASGEVVTGTSSNDFLNLLGGDDAANGDNGDDVLDGGTGSNFLTGGVGFDVFFLDGRNGQTTWATVTDWQAGEQLSMWGWHPEVSKAIWVDSAGAAEYAGITMHGDFDGDGATDTSVTWTGRTRNQLPTAVEFDGLLWFK